VRRREFISLLGGAALSPLVARAQQPKMPLVGFLHSVSPDSFSGRLAGFRQGLRETGFVEGENVAIEFRWAQGQYDRLPELAADLVRRQPSVIFAGTVAAALPAKAATATIPIVFAVGVDPAKFGLVASFNHPGGNVTGVTWLGGATLVAKRLELLHKVVPAATVIAALINPKNPSTETQARELRQAAHSLGLQLQDLNASTEGEINSAFATIVEERIGAVLIGSDAFFYDRRDQLIAVTARHSIPACFEWREFPPAGGLMSYGTSRSDAYRQAGAYAGRILKGEKPPDLPVQQATKFELVINLKTAKALGLTIPEPFLLTADQVIE
jgi:putative ABC transport system substrate-binding protein